VYKLNYRAEIDGLRAIAVVSVVLYHAKIVIFGRDWFEGGFIGVDIFFVISGYLITRIILTELEETNTFSFTKFYERRARRILPMLFLVVAVCIPFAWQKLLPMDLVDFAKSALSALGFGSNFFFYYSTTEYGANSALLKPLLHTWSLGVEEQFYIVAPIIILLIWKFARTSFLTLLIGMLLMSIQFADVMEGMNSELNFFLPFSRFWELLVGSALAFIELKYGKAKNPLLTKTLPIFGLFFIAHSILFFDVNTPHPSFQTLIPIVGVALILAFCSTEDFVGKVLSFKPIVGVGLISYSLYLWHFPIFAFSRHTSLTHSGYDKFEWIFATFILSILSFRFIETPIRNSHRVGKRAFLLLIFSALILASTVSVLIIKGVFVNSEKVLIGKLLDNRAFREEHRSFELNYDYSVLKNGKPNLLVVGNSHAEDLLKAMTFSYLAEDFNLNLTSPIRRVKDVNYQVRCLWDYFSNNDTTCTQSAGQGTVEYGPNLSEQYSFADIVVLASHWTDNDIQTLSSSISKMLDDGKKVIVVGNTPESITFGEMGLNRFDRFLFESKNMEIQFSSNLLDIEKQFFKDYENGQRKVNDQLSAIVESFANSNVVFKERSDFMCDKDEKRCFMYFPSDKAKVLWDYAHTTTDGARVLGRLITEKQWLSDIIQKE
jgi:peptidoglycan/LPS O-acetylase OafA/YrhL